jgi:hypothetical protein
VRRIDLLFVPLPAATSNRESLGLLGKIATTTCLIEPYRNAPGLEEIRLCLLRLLIQHSERQREARRNELSLSEESLEMLWVVGPTISDAVRAAFSAQSSNDWETGIYFLGSGLRTALVSIHQLPTTPDTLWLRVLGKGRVQQRAIAEVLALPTENPLRNIVLQLVASLNTSIREQPDSTNEDEQELIMNLSPAYYAWEQEVLQKGKTEGKLEGKQQLLVQQLAHKFGSLPVQLTQQLEAICDPQKLEQLGNAVLDASDLESFLKEL